MRGQTVIRGSISLLLIVNTIDFHGQFRDRWEALARTKVGIVAIQLALEAQYCPILFIVKVVFGQYLLLLLIGERLLDAIA